MRCKRSKLYGAVWLCRDLPQLESPGPARCDRRQVWVAGGLRLGCTCPPYLHSTASLVHGRLADWPYLLHQLLAYRETVLHLQANQTAATLQGSLAHSFAHRVIFPRHPQQHRRETSLPEMKQSHVDITMVFIGHQPFAWPAALAAQRTHGTRRCLVPASDPFGECEI